MNIYLFYPVNPVLSKKFVIEFRAVLFSRPVWRHIAGFSKDPYRTLLCSF